MATEKTLLERIDDPDEDGHRLSVDAGKVSQSVARHLAAMLNVRQGSVMTLPDYGMPDVNGLLSQFPSALNGMRRAIKASIEKYEPRLRSVTVQHVPIDDDPLDVRFKVAARMLVGDAEEPATFEVLIGDFGRVRVRG
jgi:type VI secretion system protein